MTTGRQRRRRLSWALSVVGILLVTVRVATWPVETHHGFNFVVSSYTMPLYLKAFEFIDRSAHYERLANTVTAGRSSDREIIEAVFEWTVNNIQPTPDNWPIVDSHILDIIIRGHGVSDQRADVLTTLATYAGVPAFWMILPEQGERRIVLSFALVDKRWVVADVANAFLFRTTQGDLATLNELIVQPALVESFAGGLLLRGVPYTQVFAGLTMPTPPDTLRAEFQMPLKRLVHEARTVMGLRTDDGSER